MATRYLGGQRGPTGANIIRTRQLDQQAATSQAQLDLAARRMQQDEEQNRIRNEIAKKQLEDTLAYHEMQREQNKVLFPLKQQRMEQDLEWAKGQGERLRTEQTAKDEYNRLRTQAKAISEQDRDAEIAAKSEEEAMHNADKQQRIAEANQQYRLALQGGDDVAITMARNQLAQARGSTAVYGPTKEPQGTLVRPPAPAKPQEVHVMTQKQMTDYVHSKAKEIAYSENIPLNEAYRRAQLAAVTMNAQAKKANIEAAKKYKDAKITATKLLRDKKAYLSDPNRGKDSWDEMLSKLQERRPDVYEWYVHFEGRRQ